MSTSLHCAETCKLSPSFPWEHFLTQDKSSDSWSFICNSCSLVPLINFWSPLQGLVYLPLVWRDSLKLVSKHSTWLRTLNLPGTTYKWDEQSFKGRRKQVGTSLCQSPEPEQRQKNIEVSLKSLLLNTNLPLTCPTTQGSACLPWSASCLALLSSTCLCSWFPENGTDGDSL